MTRTATCVATTPLTGPGSLSEGLRGVTGLAPALNRRRRMSQCAEPGMQQEHQVQGHPGIYGDRAPAAEEIADSKEQEVGRLQGHLILQLGNGNGIGPAIAIRIPVDGACVSAVGIVDELPRGVNRCDAGEICRCL
jgi:hypothetical protein